MKLYEGMFLVDASRAARDWEGTESEVTSILERHGASVRSTTRYDERKLAYPIQGHRRGAYLLAYFDAEAAAIQEMRGDLKLSEAVLRNLILRVNGDEVPEVGSLGTSDPVPESAETSDEDEDEDEDDEETPEAEEDEAEEVEAAGPEPEEEKGPAGPASEDEDEEEEEKE